MRLRRFSYTLPLLCLCLSATPLLHAQETDAPRRHGRKYKAPPDLTHIEVFVTKRLTGKPVPNAAVIFRALRDGKDDGNLELKTDPDGKATIDVIARGSNVQVQVIANGLATFADSYQIDETSREIHIAMLRPQEQVSAYEDNSGKESGRKAGVQEPRPSPKPGAPTPNKSLQPGPKPGPQPSPTPPAAPQP